MTQDYELLIKNNQDELEAKKTEMRRIKEEFINTAGVFLAQWFNSIAKNYVKEYADISIELGKEKLEQLRKDVAKLNSEASVLVGECLLPEKL